MSRLERTRGRRNLRLERSRFQLRRGVRHRSFESLEPRVVLSADLAWAFDLPIDVGQPDAHVEEGHEHRLQFEFQGGRFYSEPLVTEAAPAAGEDAGGGTIWQGYDLSQTFLLNSKPDADHTIYLDVDGHVTSGTAWNTGFNGGQDIVTPAWSADADRNTFTDSEKATIQRIWARVAEDYAPFDVNVTTKEPLPDDLIKAGSSDTRWGVRVVIGPNTWYSSAGGVAYVGSFNWNTDTPCFVFNSSENGITEASSHEVGHTLGLSHDGNSITSYYSGHGSGETSWGPIMGSTYSVNLSQWSKGEYYDANNRQDDLAIITGQNGFTYRADDYGDIFSEATELISAGSSQIDATYGIVETNTDIDTFSFLAGAGAASIDIDPFAVGPNLDILAELFDATGSLIATSDSLDEISAGFAVSLPAEGQYFLQVTGTGRGDPLGDGYTDYASLGNYRIQGTVVPYSAGNAAPVANDDQQSTGINTAVTIDVLANDLDPDGDPCFLDFATQGSYGSVVINPDKTIRYTPSLGFEGQDVFTYTISDGQGGQDTAQVTVTVAAPAVLVNGGFEDGLNGWEISGDASVQSGGFGEAPAAGQSQGLVTNVNAAGGDVPVAELETFLGIPAGSLEAVAPGAATAGSAVRQAITVTAGAKLTFQFNHLTNEMTPDTKYNDFSFFTVSGLGTQHATLLADTNAGGFASSPSSYGQSTRYEPYSYTFEQAGTFTIGFGVSDSQDTTYDTALLIDAISLQMSPNNAPPQADDDKVGTNEDTAVVIDVLNNDSDADGDALAVTVVTQGVWGTVAVNGNNTVTYTPNANFHGSDTFTYTVDDGQGGQATGTVTVTVTPVNDAPVAAGDDGETVANVAVTIDVLANDADIDGDALSVSAATQPSSGTAVVNGDNTVTYTPASGFAGVDTFSYTVDDGHGGQATATVTVTVSDAPPLVNGGFGLGLTGWEVLGAATVETAGFGEAPVEGSSQGLLTTKNGDGGDVDQDELEAFLGLNSGALDDVTRGDAKKGSAIRQTVNVAAGEQLVLQYSFLTTEKTPDTRDNDFSFLSVSGSGTQAAVFLADTYADGFSSSPTGYSESTGYRTFVYTFTTGGQYTIGFGVSDTKSDKGDSALLLDAISLQTPANAPAEPDADRWAGGGILPAGRASSAASGATISVSVGSGGIADSAQRPTSENSSVSLGGLVRQADQTGDLLADSVGALVAGDIALDDDTSHSWEKLVDLVFAD